MSSATLSRAQRISRRTWLLVLAMCLLIAAFPVATSSSRLLLAIGVPMLWLGAIGLLRRRRVLAVTVLAAGLAVAGFLMLPSKSPDTDRLRAEYVDCLKRYEGSRYVWGGENSFGIDCSGLVRRALIDAHIAAGVKGTDPSQLRAALSLWWNDCTARALSEEYLGLTHKLRVAGSINSLDPDLLQAGDLAVSAGGAHVLAYLGRGEWIEANPSAGAVIRVKTPGKTPWYSIPVTLMRWTALEAD